MAIRFDTSSLKDIESRIDFNIWANSTSVEFDTQNDYAQLSATVVKLAELSIRGYVHYHTPTISHFLLALIFEIIYKARLKLDYRLGFDTDTSFSGLHVNWSP